MEALNTEVEKRNYKCEIILQISCQVISEFYKKKIVK